MARSILEAVRVLDVSQYIAGPSCCRMLADLGADVVRVDRPGESTSALGDTYNFGKRSIVVDLKQREGVDVVRALAAHSDVLVESLRPGAMDALGLGPGDLTATNERLIYASISGFGRGTESAHRPVFGANAQAEAGLIWVMQQAQGGEEPFPAGFPVADIVTGMHTLSAILAALYDRERTGRGQVIDMALFDCQLAILNELARAPLAGQPEEAWKPAAHGIARCVDGRFITYNLLYDPARPNAGYFRAIAAALGHGETPPPADAATADRLVHAWFAALPADEAAASLERAGIAYGVVNTIHEALRSPYVAERGLIRDLPAPDGATARAIKSPWQFSFAAVGPRTLPPRPGADGRAVLAELGLEASEIDRLVAQGAVAFSVTP